MKGVISSKWPLSPHFRALPEQALGCEEYQWWPWQLQKDSLIFYASIQFCKCIIYSCLCAASIYSFAFSLARQIDFKKLTRARFLKQWDSSSFREEKAENLPHEN